MQHPDLGPLAKFLAPKVPASSTKQVWMWPTDHHILNVAQGGRHGSPLLLEILVFLLKLRIFFVLFCLFVFFFFLLFFFFLSKTGSRRVRVDATRFTPQHSGNTFNWLSLDGWLPPVHFGNQMECHATLQSKAQLWDHLLVKLGRRSALRAQHTAWLLTSCSHKFDLPAELTCFKCPSYQKSLVSARQRVLKRTADCLSLFSGKQKRQRQRRLRPRATANSRQNWELKLPYDWLPGSTRFSVHMGLFCLFFPCFSGLKEENVFWVIEVSFVASETQGKNRER